MTSDEFFDETRRLKNGQVKQKFQELENAWRNDEDRQEIE